MNHAGGACFYLFSRKEKGKRKKEKGKRKERKKKEKRKKKERKKKEKRKKKKERLFSLWKVSLWFTE